MIFGLNETKHFMDRMNQRGITKMMIELVFNYGFFTTKNEICLNRKTIINLLKKNTEEKRILLKLLDKGGVSIVIKNDTLITTYYCK